MKKKSMHMWRGNPLAQKILLIMRLTLFLMVFSVLSAFSSSYAQKTKLNLKVQNSQVKEVLNEIENQSDFFFMYDNHQVDVERRVNLEINSLNIDQALQKLFEGTSTGYKVVNRQILLFTENESSAYSQQTTKVTGKVTDGSGGTLPGVSVVVKGTTNGTITDIDGAYNIGNVPVNATLQFSFVGMKSQDIAVAGKTTINVVLEEETVGIEEVIAIGYGVQKKKLNTGSTIQVTGENLQKMSTVSALGALQSQTPGVSITQSSGMPGEGYKVTVRGLGTIGNSNPLYVIDGIAGGDINSLNPADIESVDVLKDAASAAIYGARAANGVILVTTKQGKSGKMQVTYDGYYGVQNPYKEAPLLNAKEYMTILDEINFNEGLASFDWQGVLPSLYSKIQSGEWNGTNWLKEIRNKNAATQNHAINMLGGSETSKFSLGFSYSDQQGIYGSPVEPDNKRYTARLNSEHVILKGSSGRDVVKFSENLNFGYGEKQGIGIGNIYWNDIHNMMVGSPLMPVYGTDGTYFDKKDKALTGLDLFNPDIANPIANMVYNRGQNLSKNYNLNANASLEIQPIKDLTLKSTFGYKNSASSYRQYTPMYELSTSSMNTIDKVNQSMGSGYSWTFENTISYSKMFNEHSFNAIIGQSLEKWGMGEDMNVTNGYSLFTDFEHAWLDNTKGLTAGTTTISGKPWGSGGVESFFGRLSYNYKETYMATVVMRADGSSNFARGNRWGYFPSVSAGWVMTNESFMQNTKSWLDFFKLRGSWGQNGNAAIDNFQYLATVAFDLTGAYSFGNTKTTQSTGGYAEILPNKDIKWETSETVDLGFDARFIQSRLGLAFDWYNKKTIDWLVDAPILGSYGTKAPYINGGDVVNKGFELGANWKDHVGKVNYGVNFNIAHNKNEVTRIANSEGIIHGDANVLSQGTSEMYRAQVGFPIGYFWGYKTAGVFQNLEEIAATKTFLQSKPQPGDLIFVDTNSDGKIDNKDKVEIGDPHPDFTIGFGFNVDYKGFDLNVAASGAFGQQIAKSYRSFADSYVQNYTTDIFARWHGEGTSNKLPRLTSGSNTNWQEISDIYIENGDYVKIQNVSVGYDFKKLFTKLPFSQARLYVTAQNVYTFTNYSGQDPEIGYGGGQSWVSGVDLGFYPSPRTFLMGVNLKF
ncbi:TonB family protein [Aquipluma nitroreducens]|uniref:TonB family protein n=1 Tax=Aquipluma nitroreducens TaxID=2010828 RepID=A0A5K7SAY3_9BACT|nr:TonB-dependent receptor [Aquipluma nitroreducens]BBE18639.1 TonB family protein [Aquipluma nitroreducens]